MHFIYLWITFKYTYGSLAAGWCLKKLLRRNVIGTEIKFNEKKPNGISKTETTEVWIASFKFDMPVLGSKED